MKTPKLSTTELLVAALAVAVTVVGCVVYGPPSIRPEPVPAAAPPGPRMDHSVRLDLAPEDVPPPPAVEWLEPEGLKQDR